MVCMVGGVVSCVVGVGCVVLVWCGYVFVVGGVVCGG